MTADPTDPFFALPGDPSRFIHRTEMALVDFFQSPAFEALGYRKAQRRRFLRSVHGGRRPAKLFFGHALRHLRYAPADDIAEILPKDFFIIRDIDDLRAKAATIARSVVILNNNDVKTIQYYTALYDASDALFLFWDFDNHHSENNLGLSPSCYWAAHTDLYAPAHPDNLFVLSRFNEAIARPLPCACVQWSRTFLGDRLPAIIGATRHDHPLGRHILYPRFDLRNMTLMALSRHFPDTVGPTDPVYHDRSADERLTEWIGHKLHWIVPTLADVPVRLFDALITGGLPILPEALRLTAALAHLPPDMVLFHGPADVIDPGPLVARGLKQFDDQGLPGILRRHHFALAHDHGDARLALLIDHARAVYGVAL